MVFGLLQKQEKERENTRPEHQRGKVKEIDRSMLENQSVVRNLRGTVSLRKNVGFDIGVLLNITWVTVSLDQKTLGLSIGVLLKIPRGSISLDKSVWVKNWIGVKIP